VSRARVGVIQFPGVNCEAETVRALEHAGLDAEVFRWTRPAAGLADFQAFVLPGGWSYQDRVRAGALAAKDPLLDVLEEQAALGKPVLGICNGAQVLVEAGLVPGGGGIELALARNRMPQRGGYYTRWVHCRVEESVCVFTRGLEPGTLLPMPMAHAEGRFTSAKRGTLARLARAGRLPLVYATPEGEVAEDFPENPNGAEGAAAAVCNERGNVLALMPHPERALEVGAIARGIGGEWGARRDRALERGGAEPHAPAPGTLLFTGLRRHLEGA